MRTLILPLADKANKILEKYFVRSCAGTPRDPRFTFKENGFYKVSFISGLSCTILIIVLIENKFDCCQTLKRRAAKILKDVGTDAYPHMLYIQVLYYNRPRDTLCM